MSTSPPNHLRDPNGAEKQQQQLRAQHRSVAITDANPRRRLFATASSFVRISIAGFVLRQSSTAA
jgi:hypothetical protein